MLEATLDLVYLVCILVHCYISPYTKVEESFNLQAVHDLISYGPFDLSQFDHQEFPGVVKRTFVGAGLLSSLLKPLTFIYHPLYDLSDYQLLLRSILGILNWLLIVRIRKSLKKISNNTQLSLYYALLQYPQFHVTYYSSRTLPNFILLPFTSYALGSLLKGDFSLAFGVLACVAVIFRAEIGVFAVSLAFLVVFSRQSLWLKPFVALALGGTIGLMITLAVDSYFWGVFPCVPELATIFFNVFEGKSKLWGTEPFGAYFTKYAFNIFFPPVVILLAIPGLFFKLTGSRPNTLRSVGLGSILFVLLMSFQPHKEWRFISYAIPAITILAANGAAGISKVKPLKLFMSTILIASCVLSFIASCAMLYISSLNYPGGVAISQFNNFLIDLDGRSGNDVIAKQNVTVHLDIPACMTGVSLFTYLQPNSLTHFNVNYDKSEDKAQLSSDLTWSNFDYVITDYDNVNLEASEEVYKLYSNSNFGWNKLDVIKGYAGMNISPLLKLVRNYKLAIKIVSDVLNQDFESLTILCNSVILQEPKLYIYAREDF